MLTRNYLLDVVSTDIILPIFSYCLFFFFLRKNFAITYMHL